MEADDVVRLRLRRQQLREPFAATVDEALRNLLAVQSQEFAYARWSLAQRTVGASATDIERAVSDGAVLRTHILRPTWHFVHRNDVRWLLALSAPRLHQVNAGMYRRTGIDPAEGAKSNSVLANAVSGGAYKTREQLAAGLQAAGCAASGFALAYRIMYAEASGVLVSGVPVRSAGGALKQTYALFDERVPPAPAGLMDRPRALAELVRRYFGSRGPATERDCADWSGLTVVDVRSGLRTARELDPGSLEAGEIGGVTFYWRPTPDDRAGVPGKPGRIDLIQCYDEYVMGYSRTRHFLAGSAPFAPVAGEPMHLVLRDGRFAGVWRHSFVRGGCEVDIRLDPGSGAGRGQSVGAAVAAYGSYLGMPAILR